MKLNLGCGENRLDGWENHDSDVNIERTLPFASDSVDFLLCEHCVEHIPYYQAIKFFKECYRIMHPNGVVRIIVPSLERIMKVSTEDYCRFTMKWQKMGATTRGAMSAILYAHGHQTAWTDSLLEATLFFVGFEDITRCEPNKSAYKELSNVDGHGKIIGEEFNWIESSIFEGTKLGE